METGAANKEINGKSFKQICSRLGLEDVNIVVAYRLEEEIMTLSDSLSWP